MPYLALQRAARLLPRDDPPGEALRVVAGGREGIRGGRRAFAHAAVEDDRLLLVELAGAPEELLKGDVRRVGRDPARLALLIGADIHELDVAGRFEALRVDLVCHA